ncbi:MAG: hypothetical protein WCT32_02065 [Patescibacteria group bacterium]|jgi:hypothetical protein
MDEAENVQPEGGQKKNNNKTWIIILVVILLILAGGSYYLFSNKETEVSTNLEKQINTDTSEPTTKEVSAKKTWQTGQAAIAGKFADAEVVDLGDGRYRMYYSVEPEVAGNKLEMYSATSTDGINWTKEDGERKTYATFPDVVKLLDGTFRVYFQNAGVIKSAISTDGLVLKDEPGTRIEKAETGLNIDNVAAPTTMQLSDGSYIMVYRGMINQKYGTMTPNSSTQLFFYATSTDGLTWQKRGIAVDSRNAILEGHADGPEWVTWGGSTSLTTGDDELRLYFWSYKGVYYSTYKDGVFSEPVLDFPASKDAKILYSPNPPGDPTLAKIGEKWFMYYGQHEKGIYYSTLK